MRTIVTALLIIQVAGCIQSEGTSIATQGTPEDKVIEQVQSQIRERMKDPDSAQFRNTRVYGSGSPYTICGQANSKNSYGGYVGFLPFYAVIYLDGSVPPKLTLAESSERLLQDLTVASINEKCDLLAKKEISRGE